MSRNNKTKNRNCFDKLQRNMRVQSLLQILKYDECYMSGYFNGLYQSGKTLISEKHLFDSGRYHHHLSFIALHI